MEQKNKYELAFFDNALNKMNYLNSINITNAVIQNTLKNSSYQTTNVSPFDAYSIYSLINKYDLKPELNEVYIIPYFNKTTGGVSLRPIVAYTQYLKRAYKDPHFKRINFKLTPLNQNGKNDMLGEVNIYKKDNDGTEYLAYNYYGLASELKNESSPLWTKAPLMMFQKTLISIALRQAFPEEYAGLFSEAETFEDDKPQSLFKKDFTNKPFTTPTPTAQIETANIEPQAELETKPTKKVIEKETTQAPKVEIVEEVEPIKEIAKPIVEITPPQETLDETPKTADVNLPTFTNVAVAKTYISNFMKKHKEEYSQDILEAIVKKYKAIKTPKDANNLIEEFKLGK